MKSWPFYRELCSSGLLLISRYSTFLFRHHHPYLLFSSTKQLVLLLSKDRTSSSILRPTFTAATWRESSMTSNTIRSYGNLPIVAVPFVRICPNKRAYSFFPVIVFKALTDRQKNPCGLHWTLVFSSLAMTPTQLDYQKIRYTPYFKMRAILLFFYIYVN